MYLNKPSQEVVIESFKMISVEAAKAHARAITTIDHSALVVSISEIEDALQTIRLTLLGCRTVPLND